MTHLREYQSHTFPNGIRWVHMQNNHSAVAHCGLMLDIGSRDENHDELGLAHFWEHMAFKGTKTKSSAYILNRIDSLGGELNAYTTKEKICFHATLLSKHLPKALEILFDITFRSTFPSKELEKERHVILEEMGMYADNPEDAIQDDFEALIFKNSSMGNNILGTKQSIMEIQQHHLLNFVGRLIHTERIVISTLANVSFKKLFPILDAHVSQIPAIKSSYQRKALANYVAQNQTLHKNIHQAHIMMGGVSYAITHPRRLPFFMVTNMLGGHAMNSWLNLSIREKYGLAYHVDAQYTPYSDTGLFNIYIGTDKKNITRTVDLVWKELRKMQKFDVSTSKFKGFKEQLKGQLAISEENKSGLMLLMAKATLDLGKVDSLNEIFKKIDQVSVEEIRTVAGEMFDPANVSTLTYLPS